MKISESVKKGLMPELSIPNLKLPDGVVNFLKSGGNCKIKSKEGSKIHIKKKNRGKFTDYCGGTVTSECIARGKRSSSPTIRKRATFAANARKWKHQYGGNIIPEDFQLLVNKANQPINNRFSSPLFVQAGGTIKAGQLAKKHLTSRKNPDWDNMDRGYRYLTQDMGMDHNRAIALMGNVIEESQGNYKAKQNNGGGRGLIQWDGRPAPNGRYSQWGSIWASVTKKANRYNPETGATQNYWAPWKGLKGEEARKKFNNPNTPIKTKTQIYAESYLRPGKPRIADRKLSSMQLDSIYNPNIKNITVRLKKKGGSFKISRSYRQQPKARQYER